MAWVNSYLTDCHHFVNGNEEFSDLILVGYKAAQDSARGPNGCSSNARSSEFLQCWEFLQPFLQYG